MLLTPLNPKEPFFLSKQYYLSVAPDTITSPSSVALKLTLDVSTSTSVLPPTIEELVSETQEVVLETVITRNEDGMKMVFVPEGNFFMGSDDGDNDEQPVHTVFLDAFWIDETEITNTRYLSCVKAGKCVDNGDADLKNINLGDYPVNKVSWRGADLYCKWVGAELPTEAQWEKAARGTDRRIYPWGNETPSCALSNYGCSTSPSPVGSFPLGVSPYGALDMAGNVWEWVADWYSEEFYGASPTANPTGPTIGEKRVLRGGSWLYADIKTIQATNRIRNFPNRNFDGYGFRCVRKHLQSNGD